jgi:uncharacterized membrane protein YhhN
VTATGWAWIVVAAIVAVLDWAAVAAESRMLERCVKPAVLVALIAAALTARPRHSGVHGWLVLALCFGLLGDIALSFAAPEQPPEGEAPDALFTAGLASFLLGHLCYCAAMVARGTEQLSSGLGVVLVLLALLAFGRRVLAGAQAHGGTPLAVAVAAYIAILGCTMVLGIGTSSLLVAAGIVLFAFSDLILAHDRFVVRRGWAPVTVAVSYHLAQLLLVLGLVR